MTTQPKDYQSRLNELEKLFESGMSHPAAAEAENMTNRLDGELALAALEEIPEMYKEVIFMKYVEDMSVKEIAYIIKESENAVSVKIHRGLKKIRKILNDKEQKIYDQE